MKFLDRRAELARLLALSRRGEGGEVKLRARPRTPGALLFTPREVFRSR